MADVFRSAITMSISGSVVALIVFVLKPFFRNRLSKQLQYYVWLIVLVQLLLPLSWEVSLPKFIQKPETVNVQPSFTTLRDTVDRLVITVEESQNRVSIAAAESNSNPGKIKEAQSPLTSATLFTVLLWPFGLVLSLLWSIVSYSFFTSKLKKTLTATGIRAKLPVYTSKLATTPMLIGIFKPIIVLPNKQFSREQLEFIILHELTHYRRMDIIIKWLATITAAVHWFNPMVYFIRREINKACELSCDEAVIRSLDSYGKQGYGETLISVVAESRYPAGVVSTTMCEEKKTLKERLVSIMKYRRQRKILIGISVLLVAGLALCALALSAKNSALKEPPTLSVNVNGQSLYTQSDKIYWNGVAYDNPLIFENMASNDYLKDIPPFPFGSFVELTFDQPKPDNVIISEFIIDGNGKRKFSERVDVSIPFDIKSETGFLLQGNAASMLSSNSADYELGAVIRGFLLTCTWGENQCVYAFTLRSDAGVTNTQLESGLTDIEKTIDKNLEIVISSPKISSSPAAYINEHKAEYEEILRLGQSALPYLYLIYETDKGLRGVLAETAMLEIKPDLNIRSEVEPNNKRFCIETYGFDFGSPVSGLYPAKEIRLIDVGKDEVVWSMTPGYLQNDFLWSPDGRYVAISYMARTYAETIVLDTVNLSLVPLPGMSELAKELDKAYQPKTDRADPYFWFYKWTYNSSLRLQSTFEWTTQNDDKVQGGYIYDLHSGELVDIYADFEVNPPALDFGQPDRVEIRYNYFNSFDEGYKPYATKDKKVIELIIDILKNSVIVSKLEYDDISRPNNPVALITLSQGNTKQELEYKIDTLYNKSVFTVNGINYSPNYDTARLIQNLEELRPNSTEVDRLAEALLNGFGLTPLFKFSSADVRLPENLLYKGGEFPNKLYWSHNLELSKNIGLDFTDYLGKTLRAEQYYLLNPLPKAYKPLLDAYAVILWDGSKIVGAYLNAGRGGFACSLSQLTFKDITGLDFNEWYAQNGYNMYDQANISNAKLSPEEVITKYFQALDKDDGSHFQYESISALKSYLYVRADTRKLYLSSWYEESMEGLGSNVESVKLLSMEESKAKPQRDNELIFDITIDLKVKREITTSSGIDNRSIWLVNDGAAGWKVAGTGH